MKLSGSRPAALAALLVATLGPLVGVGAAAAPDAGPPAGAPAQTVTLADLGLGPAQTVYGGDPSLEVYFPRPAGSLVDGSRLELRYAYSPLLQAPASTMTVVVNGQPQTAVGLVQDGAALSTLSVSLPVAALRSDAVNQVTLRFHLRLRSNDNACEDLRNRALYVRLDGASAIHYALAGTPGSGPPARLETYPYPIVDNSAAAQPRVGLVLPDAPADQTLAAALRLAADLGQRSGPQLVTDTVVSDQRGWLARAGEPALVIGRYDEFPVAKELLTSAGFAAGAGGLNGPTGPVAADDGVLAELIGPAGKPALVVSGGSDAALQKAAAALVVPGRAALAGSLALVHELVSGSSGSEVLTPARPVTLQDLGHPGLSAAGTGQHQFQVGFVAPAVDPNDFGYLNLLVSHSAMLSGGNSALTAALNGTAVGTLPLDRSDEQQSRQQIRFSGQLLKPGLNTLTVTIDSQRDKPCLDAFDTDYWATVGPTSTIQLPRARPDSRTSPAGLETLPYPFLDSPTGGGPATRVVIADRGAATIGSAVRLLVALGTRAVTAAPPLEVADLAHEKDPTSDGRNLLIVGVPGGPGHLDPLGSALEVAVSGGTVQVHAPELRLTERLSLQGPLGVIEEQRLPGGSGREALWLSGTDADSLDRAAAAVADRGLTGPVATVDGKGRIRSLAAGRAAVSIPEPLEHGIVRGLLAVAGLAVLGFLGWQLWRPREEEE